MVANHWLPSPFLPASTREALGRSEHLVNPPEGFSLRGSPPLSLFLSCQLSPFLTYLLPLRTSGRLWP